MLMKNKTRHVTLANLRARQKASSWLIYQNLQDLAGYNFIYIVSIIIDHIISSFSLVAYHKLFVFVAHYSYNVTFRYVVGAMK